MGKWQNHSARWGRDSHPIDGLYEIFDAETDNFIGGAPNEWRRKQLIDAHNADIDALTAERDEARAKLQSAEREIGCLQGNLRDLQEENAHTKEHANKWEARCREEHAKLDAIVAMLEPGGMPYDGGEPTDDQYRIEEWHIKKDLHARAFAIMEGREE